jgi:hypothetical protein
MLRYKNSLLERILLEKGKIMIRIWVDACSTMLRDMTCRNRCSSGAACQRREPESRPDENACLHGASIATNTALCRQQVCAKPKVVRQRTKGWIADTSSHYFTQHPTYSYITHLVTNRLSTPQISKLPTTAEWTNVAGLWPERAAADTTAAATDKTTISTSSPSAIYSHRGLPVERNNDKQCSIRSFRCWPEPEPCSAAELEQFLHVAVSESLRSARQV